jgi:hypothetical protein
MMLELIPLRIRELRSRPRLWRKFHRTIRILIHIARRIARRFLRSRSRCHKWCHDERDTNRTQKLPTPHSSHFVSHHV